MKGKVVNKQQEEEKACREAKALSFFKVNGLKTYPKIPMYSTILKYAKIDVTERELIRRLLEE
jgi:hypothetical protein